MYPQYSPLDAEISEVITVMNAAVKVMDASDENAFPGPCISCMSWAMLRPQSMQACLPHILTSDGSEPPVAKEMFGRRVRQ